ncbi:hypothetical protein D3C76_573800 [compost metagenome]
MKTSERIYVYNRAEANGDRIDFDSIKMPDGKGTDIPPAFKQTEFASSYEARFIQTPSELNTKVKF